MFWVFMFVMTLLIPLAYLLIWYMSPKLTKINEICGYRTSRSMKNQESWNFAQKYSAKLSLNMFIPTVVIAVIGMLLVRDKDVKIITTTSLIILLVQMGSFVIVILKTENALKKNFDV